MNPSLETPEDVARLLDVDLERGLSRKEAERRLAADGPNELRGAKTRPAWRVFLAQFNDPLIYLLLGAIAVSIIAWILEGAEGWPIDSVVISAIVALNAALGFVHESRAASAVAALATMTAAASTVIRDGSMETIPSSGLVRGDLLALGEGDSVGADARIVSADSLRIAEASLTGESEAVGKHPERLSVSVPLGDRSNMVFKGTSVVQGVGRALVTATGMDTEIGAIAHLLDATVEEPTPLSIEVSRIGRMLGAAVIAIAIVVMGTITLVNGVSTPSDFVVVLLLGVSLAVAAVPEGLPAILSLVLAIGVQRMARRNAVVKRLSAVESLGSASVICTDKTGTLTRNQMTIARLFTASGQADVTGSGYVPAGDVLCHGEPLRGAQLVEAQLALAAGALANDAQLAERDGKWEIQGDPTEAAFLVAARKLHGTTERVDGFSRQAEIPFTSERKLMSTVQNDADGRTLLFSKGAPDVLLANCTRLRVGEENVPLSDAHRKRVLAEIEELSCDAFRTLGVAYRPVGKDETSRSESLEDDLVYVGTAGIIDPPRVEVAAAIAEAQQAGIRIIMITGDHPATAARIAADLGITAPGDRAVSGVEIDDLDDNALRGLTRTVSVYARVAPVHKLRLVDALQSDGRIVAMTGDGVNDAPALKSADIGIAMGITGTEVTKEAARMILADDNFATIVAAVRQGRAIFDNIKKFLRYLLSSNMGEVLTVFLGVVFAAALGLTGAGAETIALPLLATQILWINLVTDSGPALAMGVDPEIDDVMARQPRKPTDRAIDARMWGGILSVGLVMALATLVTIDRFLPGGLLVGTDSLEVARTAAFTTLVFAQLFNVFNARSETTTAFHGIFTNPWLWGSVILAAVLQVAVVHIPFLQVAFGTAPLAPAHWLWCVAAASCVLLFGELRKAIHRGLARA